MDREKARSQYWDEISFLEDLWEFHPEVFDALTPRNRHVLRTYYALDVDVPDVYVYKRRLDRQAPELAREATNAINALRHRGRLRDCD